MCCLFVSLPIFLLGCFAIVWMTFGFGFCCFNILESHPLGNIEYKYLFPICSSLLTLSVLVFIFKSF